MSLLSDLFAQKKDVVINAKIIGKQGVSSVIVLDAKNRKFTVDSDGSYGIGQTVRVKNNVVICKVKSNATRKHCVL